MLSSPFDKLKKTRRTEQGNKMDTFPRQDTELSSLGKKWRHALAACIPESIMLYICATLAIAANVSSKMDRGHCSPWFRAGATPSTTTSAAAVAKVQGS
jgi:hypothetical protein